MAQPRNPYSNIKFESNVDWVHIDPSLLTSLNQVAKRRGETVDVFSGYRPPNSPYGFKGDPHQRGIAVDAYVGGVPIGEVWRPSDFTNAGLRSGNQPNFYKGKPDPSHVDLGLEAPSYTGKGNGTDTGTQQQQQAPPTDTTQQPDLAQQVRDQVANSPTIGPNIGPNVLQAQDVMSPPGRPATLPPRFQTWNLLAQLPGASPDTLKMSQYAGLEDAGP